MHRVMDDIGGLEREECKEVIEQVKPGRMSITLRDLPSPSTDLCFEINYLRGIVDV